MQCFPIQCCQSEGLTEHPKYISNTWNCYLWTHSICVIYTAAISNDPTLGELCGYHTNKKQLHSSQMSNPKRAQTQTLPLYLNNKTISIFILSFFFYHISKHRHPESNLWVNVNTNSETEIMAAWT